MLVTSLSFQKMHMEFGSQERTLTFIVVDILELLFKRTKASLNHHQAWYPVTHPVPHLPLVLCSVIHACSHCQRPPGQLGIPANRLPLSSKGLENKEEGWCLQKTTSILFKSVWTLWCGLRLSVAGSQKEKLRSCLETALGSAGA